MATADRSSRRLSVNGRAREDFRKRSRGRTIVCRPARSLADLTAAWLDISERLKRRYSVWRQRGWKRYCASPTIAGRKRNRTRNDQMTPLDPSGDTQPFRCRALNQIIY